MLLMIPWLENNKLLLWTSEFKWNRAGPGRVVQIPTTNGLLIARILWNNAGIARYKISRYRYGTTNR